MDRYLLRRIIVVVLLFTLLIFGFTWTIRKITSRPTTKITTPKIVLSDLANSNQEVKLVTEGKIVGNETHRELRITISGSARTLEIIEGYENTVVSRQVFPNNQDSYQTFLSALQDAGFTKSRIVRTGVIPQGTCPTGQRYWYQIVDGIDYKQSLWNTSCSSAQGTFAGKSSTVSWLFKNQIPDYQKLVSGVQL